MNNKQIIKELVKTHILTMRWVERNTNLICATHRDIERILTSNKLTCTYKEAVQNLKVIVMKYCKQSNYLLEQVSKLEKYIIENNISNLRFGVEPQLKFTDEEKELINYKLQLTLQMVGDMVSIKYIAEKIGVTESAIKQACQQERLLNTKKIGNNWIVNVGECAFYWNVKELQSDDLYC